jgi:hypothetical protein
MYKYALIHDPISDIAWCIVGFFNDRYIKRIGEYIVQAYIEKYSPKTRKLSTPT